MHSEGHNNRTIQPGFCNLRHPLVGCFILFATGMLTGIQLLPPFMVVWCVSVISLTIGLLRWKSFSSHCFVFTALYGCGMLSGILAVNAENPSALENLLSYSRIYMTLEGTVKDDPVYTPCSSGYNCEFDLELKGIQREKQWQTACGRLKVTAEGVSYGQLQYGELRRAEGLIKLNRRYRIGNAGWLYTDGAHIQQLETNEYNLRALCYRARRHCARILSLGPGDQAITTRLLKALLLGYREDIPYDMREIFSTTGTFHIFAISGLHVGIVTMLLIGLLKLPGIPKNRWVYWLIPMLLIYTLSTGARASAIRASIMAIVYWSALSWKRRPDSLSALSATAFIILAVNPNQILQPGFIMSFAVVTGIITMYPRLFQFFRKPFMPDPLRLQKEHINIRLLRRSAYYILGLFCVSLAAWLSSMPLTATYFNVFCPISLLGNIIVVPGTFLVVYTGCLALISGLISPGTAEIFNYANAFFVRMLLTAVYWMQQIPYGHFFIKSPPLWLIGSWYGILILLFSKRKKLIVSGLVLLTGLIAGGCMYYIHDNHIQVDVIDAGQGNAAFVNLPRSANDMLVDAGPSIYASRVLRHLRKQGVDSLGVMVLTHPDPDHIGAADILLNQLPIHEIWCPDPKLFGSSLQQSFEFMQFTNTLRKAREKGCRIRYVTAGDRDYANGVQRDVFWPAADMKSHTPSDGSVVLRIARDGCAVLFMGGARRRVENRILDKQLNPAAPLIIAGDHASHGTLNKQWLEVTNPETVIICTGFYNNRGTPAPDVLQRIKHHQSDIWRTDIQNGLRIRWLPNTAYPYYLLSPIGEEQN